MKIKDYQDAIEFFRTNDYKAADGAWSEFYQSEVLEPRIMDLAEGGPLDGTPTKEVTQHGRRIYETPEGERVSEKSKTLFFNGKWVNVPSIHDGVQHDSEDRLRNMLKHGKIQATSEHQSRMEAEEAAASRSNMMKSHVKGFDDGGQVIGKPGGLVEPGVMYYGKKIKLTSTHKKNILEWGKNKGGGEWSNERIFEEYEKSGPNRRADIREGLQKGTLRPLKKLSTKEVQALYKDLPENVSIQVQKRGKKKIPEYTFRAKVSGKNVGKENWTMDLKATPENKTKIIEETQKVLDEYHPNRLSREEYAKLRLKPENRRLRGEDFAKKLNDAGYTTYAGDEWARENVYNYDRETPRSSKRLAKDLGFFEKRTVAEAKDIIKQYSGGKHFLKNKNLTDVQITTRAAEYVAMEKNIEKTGGTYSFPRGRQNKRKVWQNIYSSHSQGGRFKLANADELPKFENGRINWRKDKAWRKAKFKDSKSGKIFTYDNLEKMVDKHGGGWNKAVKAYDDNARLNQMTFKGKALNEWFREGMIKKEYETLVGKKVPFKDKGLQKYMGEKKPYYSFTEAHHFKGVKDHPFDTESSFRYANRRQGNIQNSYDKAIKSGKPDRIAKAKTKYVEDMTNLSDEMGGIRYKMDDTRFVGAKGTDESIIRAGAKVSGMSEANQIKLLKQLGYRCKQASGGGETVACYLEDVKKTKAEARKGNPTAINKQRKAFDIGKKIKGFGKLLRRGVQGTLGTVGLAGPIGWGVEGIIEGGIYDYYKRQGYSNEQAFAETFTPRLAKEALEGKSTEDVPWYGGAEELIEKEKIGTRWDPSGKVNLAAKYADAKSKHDEAVEKYYEIQGSTKPTTLEQSEALQAKLAEQAKIIQALEPSIKAGTPEYEAYQQAEERQTGLMDERRRAYLEKTDPKFLEREEKSFDIYGRDREGNILYEKMTSPFKKRYKEMDEWKGGRDAFTIKPGEYIDWGAYGLDDEEGIKEKWRQIYEEGGMDLLDRIAVAGGVSNLAQGGIASLKKKW